MTLSGSCGSRFFVAVLAQSPKNAILLISILFWEALPVNAEPIRVLQIMPAMDAGGMETFVMNVYRTLDREQVQFDFCIITTNRVFLMTRSVRWAGASIS